MQSKVLFEGEILRMFNWKRLVLLLLLLNLVVVPVMAEKNPVGQFASRPQLIGYWELIPHHPDYADNPKFNPGPLPFQWFAFYESGKMVSIKTSDPFRKVTPKDLDILLRDSSNQAATFTFSNGFLTITESGETTSKELWGVNAIIRKAMIGKVEYLPGDLVMSLDDGGKVAFYRHLRRIFLSEYDAGKSNSTIKSTSYTAKDGQSISAAEREMIRALVPYFTAVNTKDTVTMKKLFPGLQSQSDDRLRALPVKDYTLHGLEEVSYDGSRLRAVAVYSFEVIDPNTIGRNISTASADVDLALENGSWVIVNWSQRDDNREDIAYFTNMFSRQESASKRYGTTDLAKWDGL
ncbi:MAG TPA: hypothetical protein DCP36_02370 [Sporomusaceae bacterium]|nr:hypothetical protein [Sporomusaceae bacterium]